MESFCVKGGAERVAVVWSDACSRKAHGYGCLQGDPLPVRLSTQGEQAGLGGAEAEAGWSWMKLDGAGYSHLLKHLISAVVFYFSGVLEWKFAFNPSLTS